MKQPIALVAVCTLAVACTDKPSREPSPTAPSAAVVPAATMAPSMASTICLSYTAENSRLEAALTKTPDDARLKSQQDAIKAAIKDACN